MSAKCVLSIICLEKGLRMSFLYYAGVQLKEELFVFARSTVFVAVIMQYFNSL